MSSTIEQLAQYGQSIWLDYISRSMLESGELKERIRNGLRGMTSNPSIFNQVISSSQDYDAKIIELKRAGKSTFEIYDELTIHDIQAAADAFQSVYKNTNGLDGYVSLEINPLLAHEVEKQFKEGMRLFKKVNRPNVMIKVPSTEEGIVVFEELISQGVNVNVTLIFSLEQYKQTAQVYFKGLNRLAQKNFDVSRVRSVASVFVSRVDSFIDKVLDQKIALEFDQSQKARLQSIKGKAAVANCRLIFEQYNELFTGNEFKKLSAKKAHEQRVLWGSTSTKNPAYSDIKYVSELIAKPTVNTVPENTLMAFLDHGSVDEAFTGNRVEYDEAKHIIDTLKTFGIDVNQVCEKLLTEGVDAFNKAFESLLESIERKADILHIR